MNGDFQSTFNFLYPSWLDGATSNTPNDRWEIRLSTLQSLLPPETASDVLSRFWMFAEETADLYVGRGMDREIQNFALRLGEVSLEVFCPDGIYLGIVATFCKRMEEALQGGLVGMFQAQVINTVTGYSMWVKLKIFPRPH